MLDRPLLIGLRQNAGARLAALGGAVLLTAAVLSVRPTPRPAATGHEDHRTRTALRLPFRGEWYVAWGGREAHQNRHVRARDQRFAYDFVVLRDGSTHEGDGSENADYHCFGRPVLAPAGGRGPYCCSTVYPSLRSMPTRP